MDHQTQLELIDEILGLSAAKSAFLDETVTGADVRHYTDPDHFDREMQALFRGYPLLVTHASDLPEPGAFLRRDIAGLPALLTRDRDGTVHAFLNVCRHRGARLVDDERGCKSSFSCPYHAWTWSNDGTLRGIPHAKQGFPGIDKSQLGLKRLPCAERFGWIWVLPQPGAQMEIDRHLRPLAADLAWLDMTDMRIAHSELVDCAANWKILTEGGIEAYHFRVAHADTIGPFFPDNLSTYQCFGPHLRSVLPRVTMEALRDLPRSDWDLRAHANILYTLFPGNQFLVQQDHIAWIQLLPQSADRTLIRLSTVVPAGAAPDSPDRQAHWARNHAITRHTLTEDFEIGEAVQSGLRSGANERLTFGRYEGALDKFNRQILAAMAGAA